MVKESKLTQLIKNEYTKIINSIKSSDEDVVFHTDCQIRVSFKTVKDIIPRWHFISDDFLTHLVVVGTKRFYGVTGWKHRTIVGPKILVSFGVGIPITRTKYHVLAFGLPHFRLARVDVKGVMSKTLILEYDYLQGVLNNAPEIDKVRLEFPVKKSGAEKMRNIFLKLANNARTNKENLRGFFTYRRT